MTSTKADMCAYEESMYRLLDENSTRKYFIEYRRYLTNHMSQGLHALFRLNAPISIAVKFVKRLDKILEASNKHLKSEDIEPDDIGDLLGARKSFYYIYDYYTKLLSDKYKGCVPKMIADEFPKLSPGVHGSALHGLIHLGYGLSAGKDWFVCEGFAYLHYSNLPLVLPAGSDTHSTLGCGTNSIIDVLGQLREDKKLIEFMMGSAETEEYWAKAMGPFSRRSGLLLTYKGCDLINYIKLIKFPEDINSTNLKKDKVPELAKWLVDCAITVYAISKTTNDFFLLHGVTASWGLKNILSLITSVDDVLKITQTFLAALFATYMAQGYPVLQRDLMEKNNGLSFDWRDIVQNALTRDGSDDEHVYKLVQVCWEMSKQNPDSDMESIYRLSAQQCVTNHFTF